MTASTLALTACFGDFPSASRPSGVNQQADPADIAEPARHIDDVAIASLANGASVALPAAPVQIHLAWAASTAGRDLDLSVVLCGADGRAVSVDSLVFFNQPVGADGTVRTVGRHRSSDATSTNTVAVDLPRVPAGIARLVVAVSVDGTGAATLADVGDLRVVVTDARTALALYPVAGQSGENAVEALELYRQDGEWSLRAVGKGWRTGLSGLAREYGIVVKGD
ncbi:MAG TPA: TerD family protein [Micromonosporaceae bacterium]|nr:TerD family protein [Micromonosporaceae bacterium]